MKYHGIPISVMGSSPPPSYTSCALHDVVQQVTTFQELHHQIEAGLGLKPFEALHNPRVVQTWVLGNLWKSWMNKYGQ